MKKYCIYLFLLLTMLATGECLKAGDMDSSLNRVRDYIAQRIQQQVTENAERVKKGLPKNHIIVVDTRGLNGQAAYTDTSHVINLRQAHTSQETVDGIWNFTGNQQLQTLSKQLNDFSAQNGFDYYLVIAAIYNIDEDKTENTDFSQVSWQGIEGIKDTGDIRTVSSGDDALEYYTADGTDKFSRLSGMLFKKLPLPKDNALYHFVITTYFPYESKTTGTVGGRIAHLQALLTSSISQNETYNSAFINYTLGLSIKKSDKETSTKEGWLLAGVSATQDFIAAIRNFKPSDIMAINTQDSMLKYLKNLPQPSVLLSGIDFPTRAHIIKVLSTGKLHDDYWISLFGNGGENAMLAVIKTTPGTQADSLKQLLSDSSYALLKTLNEEFDDAGIWGTGNNYTHFVQSLAIVLGSGLTADQMTDILDKGRIYKLSISSTQNVLVNAFSNDMSAEYDKQLQDTATADIMTATFKRDYTTVGVNLDDITSYNLVSHTETWSYQSLADLYSKQAQDNTYVAKQYATTEFDTNKSNPAVSEPLGPFDMIMVIPQKDFTINGFTLAKGSFQPIPLYYYYWLRKKHDNQQWIDLGEDAGNVLLAVSMVTGIGEIVEGGNLGLQLMRGAQVLFDAKILLNTLSGGQIDAWLKDKLGEEGFTIYKFIEYSYLIYTASKGGLILAKKAGSVMSKAVSRLYEIIKNNKELLANLKTNAVELYNAFKTYFKNVLGKDLDETAGATTTVAKTLADGLSAVLKSAYTKLVKAGLVAREESGVINFYQIKSTGEELVAVIKDDKLYFKYEGYGGDVVMVETATTTVLGKWIDGKDKFGTSKFLNGDKTNGLPLGLPEGSFTRGDANVGGMNFLDIPSDEYADLLTKNIQKYLNQGKTLDEAKQLSLIDGNEEFWQTHNYPFLVNAFKRGDNVRLVSDGAFYKAATDQVGGFFKRELQAIEDGIDGQKSLMEQYGYSYDPKTFTYYKK